MPLFTNSLLKLTSILTVLMAMGACQPESNSNPNKVINYGWPEPSFIPTPQATPTWSPEPSPSFQPFGKPTPAPDTGELWVDCDSQKFEVQNFSDLLSIDGVLYALSYSSKEVNESYLNRSDIMIVSPTGFQSIRNQDGKCLNSQICIYHIEKDHNGLLWFVMSRYKNNIGNHRILNYDPKTKLSEVYFDLESRYASDGVSAYIDETGITRGISSLAGMINFVIPYGSNQIFYSTEPSWTLTRSFNFYTLNSLRQEQKLFLMDEANLPHFSFRTFAVNPNTQAFYFGGIYKRNPPYKSEIVPNEGLSSPYSDDISPDIIVNNTLYYVDDIVFSSLESNRILKSDFKSFKATNLAGNGVAGFKDGKGEEVQFSNPTALDRDDEGNIYVLDAGNKAIRKVKPDGVVTTVFKIPAS